MSYQVLARKWRPRNFGEVVGQQHVLQALTNALTHQRLHHAYLLTGTRGVGKTTIARILSRSLNCATGITPTPCGECSACIDIEAGRFVDLMEIDAASRTKVEDTREILENVQYRPTSGRYKVYLIDEVHMLSRHSFNALLKTLEEPPPHVVFVLATTDPDKLPVTVLSRCLQFSLRALTRDEISGQLEHILKAENIPFEPAALALLARSASGSMRDALSLTDQAIAQGNQQVSEQEVARMLGRIDNHNLLALLGDITDGKVDQVLNGLRNLVDKVPDIAGVLAELQGLLHQLALVQVAPNMLDPELHEQEQEMLALAKKIAPTAVQVYYRMVLEGRRELAYAPDAFSGVEMTLLRLLAFRPAGEAPTTVGKPPQGEKPLAQEQEPSAKEQEPSARGKEPSAPEEPSAQQEPSAPEKANSAPEKAKPAPEEATSAPAESTFTASTHFAADDEVPGFIEEDDEDYQSLHAEQAQIEAQASAQQMAHASLKESTSEGAASDKADSSVAGSAETTTETGHAETHSEPQAGASANTTSSSDLSSLLATRQRLAAKRKESSGSQPAQAKPASSAAKVESPKVESPKPAEGVEIETREQANSESRGLDNTRAASGAGAQATVEQGPNQASRQANEHAAVQHSGQNSQQTPTPAATGAEKITAAAQVDEWAAIIEKMNVVGRTRQVLLHAVLQQEPNRLILEVDAAQQALLSGHMDASIKHELGKIMNVERLQIKTGSPERTPFKIQQEIDAKLLQDAQARVAAHPGIQQLQKTFAAEVTDVSILH
ncbi:DNA polymerase III subunit gamma/tau [Aliidiomarina iranensis]|uniref:DNA polymerase III subunit gamma/tau n=1 Tax=Aliidiomarina iranensis TaxID=1434071 RepID=A0A432VSI8_9GAMM|nr:DNA polymerase III subunit gamma/tau [Aliidiomarina iranensis]RUO19340.1 DNA polymerase III subunit gamma/tau [Aliidiomarina iranensis]